MGTFSQIIGHDQAVDHLEKAIASGKVSHAYLIQGENGIGKRMLAGIFAQTLQCEQGGIIACEKCHSCIQAVRNTHPDIISITHEKPGLISVEEIRRQLVDDIQVKPYSGKYKIYIVEDAEKMNVQAQNALLKTLEEPPSYAVILLLTTNAEMLLETVRSRCVPLNLKPVKNELVEQYLMEHAKVPDYQARLCAAFAQGSIGKAMELARSENFSQIRTTALMLVQRSKNMDVTQISSIVKEMAQYKVTINEFLDILAVWYRDILYFKATRQADNLVFKDQLPQIRDIARTSSYEGIETILQAIRTAEDRLSANVSFDLVMELLFLTIKEN